MDTTTTSAPASFEISASDFIELINVQLVVLVDEASTPLPTEMAEDGSFGGPVTADTSIFVNTDGGALFGPVTFATVRITGSDGGFQTPARLLAGVGASLTGVGGDPASIAAAFNADALPQLSSLTQERTVIPVGDYYDLTAVVPDSSTLAYIYTPPGVEPPDGAEDIGRSTVAPRGSTQGDSRTERLGATLRDNTGYHGRPGTFVDEARRPSGAAPAVVVAVAPAA